MRSMKMLDDLRTEIRECARCGACQAHCPVYLVSKREGTVARGKVALAAALLEGASGLETRLQQDINMCLMCGSCEYTCPNGVPTPEIVGAIRRCISSEQGLSVVGKAVKMVTSARRALKLLSKCGSFFSPIVFQRIPKRSGLRLRFPVSIMKDRTLPSIPFRNLFDRVPEFVEGRLDMPIIAFFAGCGMTYVYPQIGEMMVAILNRMGFSVFIPRSQQCCGMPALASGNGKLIEELTAMNIEAFTNTVYKYRVQNIVTGCASCGAGIGDHFRAFDAPPELIGKLIDFSVFVHREGLLTKLAAMPPHAKRKRVTYHDPCHLKSRRITREPRSLLRTLPNVEFVEMGNASSCCGMGGTFSVYYYETSRAIGALKVGGLRKSGAELVATSCPGCIMQLQDIINHSGLEMRSTHILELVHDAMCEDELP